MPPKKSKLTLPSSRKGFKVTSQAPKQQENERAPSEIVPKERKNRKASNSGVHSTTSPLQTTSTKKRKYSSSDEDAVKKNKARYPSIPYTAPIMSSTGCAHNSHYNILLSEVDRLCAAELKGLESFFHTHLPNRLKPLETLRHLLNELPQHLSSTCRKDVTFVCERNENRVSKKSDEQLVELRRIVDELETRLNQLKDDQSVAFDADPDADVHSAHRICANELTALDDALTSVLVGLSGVSGAMDVAEQVQGTLYDVRTSIAGGGTKTGHSSATPKKILRSMQKL